MRTIAIVNQKGGCGKTTTAISLSGALASLGKRVLLVDMDPQSHCAAGLAIPEAHIELDVGDAMLASDPGQLDLSLLLWRINRNLDLLPSRMKLAGLEASRGGLASLEDKERRLSRVLEALDGYDLAIVDCSPSIGLLTYNALCAADEVLIPVEMSYFAQQGASRQIATLRSVGQRLGRKARHWILPTIHEPASALPCELLDQLRARFGAQVCPVVIHKDDKVKEAATFGRPVGEYAPQSQAAQDYQRLARWVLGEPIDLADGQADAQADGQPIEAAAQNERSAHIGDALWGSKAQGQAQTQTQTQGQIQDQDQRPIQSGTGAGTDIGIGRQGAPARTVADVAERAHQVLAGDRGYAPQGVPPGAGPGGAVGSGTGAGVGAGGGPAVGQAFDEQAIHANVLELERLLLPKRGSEAFGAHPVRGGAWLVQPIGLGHTVAVAGTFNNWSPQTHRFVRYPALGVHALKVSLPVGRHAYRLVVDGLWTADPFNPVAVTNPYGEPNSIVEVAEPGPSSTEHADRSASADGQRPPAAVGAQARACAGHEPDARDDADADQPAA